LRSFWVEELFRQLKRIHWPEALGPGVVHIRPPSCGTAFKKSLDPPVGNGAAAINGAQKGTTNCSVGIGIAAAHDGVHYSFFKVRSVRKLP
jgi:hypothetical protein